MEKKGAFSVALIIGIGFPFLSITFVLIALSHDTGFERKVIGRDMERAQTSSIKVVSAQNTFQNDLLPITKRTTIGVTTRTADDVNNQPASVRGVDCETCHNFSRSTGMGNGSCVLTPNKFGRPLKFGPRKEHNRPSMTQLIQTCTPNRSFALLAIM